MLWWIETSGQVVLSVRKSIIEPKYFITHSYLVGRDLTREQTRAEVSIDYIRWHMFTHCVQDSVC